MIFASLSRFMGKDERVVDPLPPAAGGGSLLRSVAPALFFLKIGRVN
jgi:hypothetical protein